MINGHAFALETVLVRLFNEDVVKMFRQLQIYPEDADLEDFMTGRLAATSARLQTSDIRCSSLLAMKNPLGSLAFRKNILSGGHHTGSLDEQDSNRNLVYSRRL
jgi:hypothetical protein